MTDFQPGQAKPWSSSFHNEMPDYWYINEFEHGLRMPNEAFFSLKSRTFGLGQTNWADKFKSISGIFVQTINTQFGTVSSLSILQYSTIISKKLSLYIRIPNNFLRLGFEFGLQRIRELAFMCLQFVVPTMSSLYFPALVTKDFRTLLAY